MIPLYKPHMPELNGIDEILHSGSLASGKYTLEFEKRIAEFIGVKAENVLVTNSFNMAIAVVNSLLDIKSGDEIIASPMACLASTQPFSTSGIYVRWADVNPLKGTLDPDSVEKRVTKNTKAIFHNHFCGFPGYIDEINQIGKKYGIPVIDDGIECFGSEYKGNKVGNCGTDITIFSFNAVRIPNTIDGGAIILNDSSLINKARMIRDCGIDRLKFRDSIGEISPECDIYLAGYSATMSNVNSYIGIRQMDSLSGILKKQRLNAEKWDRNIENYINIKPIYRENILPNYWIYGTLADNKRQAIEEFREKGYYASGVHINNNIYSIFENDIELPGVDEFYSHFVGLPCGWWMEEK